MAKARHLGAVVGAIVIMVLGFWQFGWVLGGKADHRDEVLTDAQREREIQVCVSRAMPGEMLILDL